MDLHQWFARRRESTHYRARRSQRVSRYLRWVLPGAISLTLLGLVGWPHVEAFWLTHMKAKKIAFEARQIVHKGSLINPRYHAVNRHNQSYDLQAQSAVAVSEEMVELFNPQGGITLSPNQHLSLKAGRGFYRQGERQLNLEGGVEIKDKHGHSLRFESSQISFQEGKVESDALVEGEGPLGRIEARGFEIKDKGETLIFKGRAKIVIIPEKAKKQQGK